MKLTGEEFINIVIKNDIFSVLSDIVSEERIEDEEFSVCFYIVNFFYILFVIIDIIFIREQ